ncbi:hypothetical protein [Salipiger abyssi]|uniref:hypothetical protein n=1 Tax=Salipiger abyssi TaxID=1250539 RepID=UPI001A8E9FE9|nr:hypothetical protein [Salipiger abyssi]MBN9886191.1 hypothetical protein [Salipiger abyssi]
MTPETLTVFTLCFVAGPLLFALILQLGQSLALLLSLALGVVAAALAAIWLQAGGMLFAALALLWFAWVLAIAMLALTLHRRVPQLRRGVTIIGLLVTTLPWFGLATARMLMS